MEPSLLKQPGPWFQQGRKAPGADDRPKRKSVPCYCALSPGSNPQPLTLSYRVQNRSKTTSSRKCELVHGAQNPFCSDPYSHNIHYRLQLSNFKHHRATRRDKAVRDVHKGLVVDVKNEVLHTGAYQRLLQSTCQNHPPCTQFAKVDGLSSLLPIPDTLRAPHFKGSSVQVADIECPAVSHVGSVLVHRSRGFRPD